MTGAELGWHSGQQTTINAVYRRTLEQNPNRCFLDFEGQKITYREFDEEVSRLTRGLRELGIGPGKTVATLLDNNLDALLLWFAINRLGGIFVPVNTAFKGSYLRHQIADCAAEVIVTEGDFLSRFHDIAGELPAAKILLCRDNALRLPVGLPFEVRRLDDYRRPGTERIVLEVAPGDIAILIYTAGTTGPSKGCMLPHNQVCNLARQTVEHSRRRPDDVAWTCLPFFHINALATTILSSAMVGGTAAVSPRFSVSHFWDDVERANAVIATGIGTMIPFIANAPDTPAMLRYRGKLRMMRGAPFAPDILKIWQERFLVKESGSAVFGTTEAANITGMPPGEYGPPGTSGLRNESFDARIVDDNDIEVPEGEVGELVIRPKRPNVMFKGYWNRPADTMKVWNNLWMHMGDLARFDKDGYFWFVDRKKDYLRRRGENVSSFEVENTFMLHPALHEVALHAVPAQSEDDIKLTAVLKPGAKLTEEELVKWADQRLPYFAVPRYVEFRESLPKNPVGRILKYQLREEGCTPKTWDIEKTGIKLTRR